MGPGIPCNANRLSCLFIQTVLFWRPIKQCQSVRSLTGIRRQSSLGAPDRWGESHVHSYIYMEVCGRLSACGGAGDAISRSQLVCREEDGQTCTQLESRRYGTRLQNAVLRWQGSKGRFPQPVPREEECRAGVLRLRFYRRLNRADEKLPAESEEAGSDRHPGPGCEHG